MPLTGSFPDQTEQLQHLVKIGIALSSERDLESLLQRILLEARILTNSEAGTLYTVESKELHFRVLQNDVLDKEENAQRAQSAPFGRTLPLEPNSLAGYTAVNGQPLHLPDVYAIPADAQFRFDDSFDRASGYKTHSTLLVPMSDRGGRGVGVLQLINPLDETGQPAGYTSPMRDLVMALASQAAVALTNAHLTSQLEEAHLETIFRLGVAAEYRDKETGYHLQRMSRYSQVLALEMGMSVDEARDVLHASPLHDVGKIGIPDAILCKPAKLTAEEWVIMKEHTTMGAEILSGSDVEILKMAQVVALTHHEKWDGSGYPNGLSGTEIPLTGRIVAMADVFDALLSKRVYKDEFTLDDALKIIEDGTGSHFDPDVAAALHRAMPRLLEIRAKWADPKPE